MTSDLRECSGGGHLKLWSACQLDRQRKKMWGMKYNPERPIPQYKGIISNGFILAFRVARLIQCPSVPASFALSGISIADTLTAESGTNSILSRSQRVSFQLAILIIGLETVLHECDHPLKVVQWTMSCIILFSRLILKDNY